MKTLKDFARQKERITFELDRRNLIDRTVDWRELSVDKTAFNWQVHDLKKDIKRIFISL